MAICHLPKGNMFLGNLRPFGFLKTASSRRPLAARMDGVSKIFPIHYDATSPTSKEKRPAHGGFCRCNAW
jgi:hypothetical protein